MIWKSFQIGISRDRSYLGQLLNKKEILLDSKCRFPTPSNPKPTFCPKSTAVVLSKGGNCLEEGGFGFEGVKCRN
jgi:hypothetical protein